MLIIKDFKKRENIKVYDYYFEIYLFKFVCLNEKQMETWKDGEIGDEESEMPSQGGGNIGDSGWSHFDDFIQRECHKLLLVSP